MAEFDEKTERLLEAYAIHCANGGTVNPDAEANLRAHIRSLSKPSQEFGELIRAVIDRAMHHERQRNVNTSNDLQAARTALETAIAGLERERDDAFRFRERERKALHDRLNVQSFVCGHGVTHGVNEAWEDELPNGERHHKCLFCTIRELESRAAEAESWARRVEDGFLERHDPLEPVCQRLTDLVRYQRSELHDAGLIDDEEYAALVADSESGQRVARLEGYDRMKARAAEAEAAVLALHTLSAGIDHYASRLNHAELRKAHELADRLHARTEPSNG